MIQEVPEKISSKINNSLASIFKDIIIPPLCTVCGKIDPELLCWQCRSKIKKIGSKICKYCGRPLSEINLETGGCNFCRDENFNFYRHRSLAIYDGEMKKIIRKYKYNKIYELKKILAAFLKQTYIENYKCEKINYMDTVPGKHMEILCSLLSKLIKVPFIGNILRIKRTLKQQGLDFTQRKSNIKEAFKVKDNLLISKKNILLVDDVWTTGSTLGEISSILKKSGAGRIYLLTLARGI